MLNLNSQEYSDQIAIQNINNIREVAIKTWGSNVEFSDITIIDSPYAEFSWHFTLYGRYEIMLKYDRSLLGIYVKTDDYQSIRNLTDQEVLSGFQSCEVESLTHNFLLLDDVIKGLP